MRAAPRATATPTPAPTATPAATGTPSGSTAPTATPAPASPTPMESVSADQLVLPGKLVICSDIPYPPQEFFDAQGNPVGSDIEIGQTIAQRLGLTPDIQNSVFDTIIAALQGGKCDIIISAQNITTDRVKQVDMIPYFQAGQSFVVAAGNPEGIKVQDDLCGKNIAAETGTTEVDYLNGTGDYKGQGLSAACVAKGKADDHRDQLRQGQRRPARPADEQGRRLLRRLAGGRLLHRPARRPVRPVRPDAGRRPRGHQRRQR